MGQGDRLRIVCAKVQYTRFLIQNQLDNDHPVADFLPCSMAAAEQLQPGRQ